MPPEMVSILITQYSNSEQPKEWASEIIPDNIFHMLQARHLVEYFITDYIVSLNKGVI